MSQNKASRRWAQAVAGSALLAIAVTAGATGLSINVLHGLEVNIAAAILFGLADLTKIVLPIVVGIIGWTKQTRLTALVCVVVSVFCASNAYVDGAGNRIADKQHGADQYASAQADVARIEKEIAELDARAAQEAKNGGCGKNCRFLTERAEQRRNQLIQAKQVLKNATPIDISGNERLKANITAALFLILIEALIFLSIPAMALLTRPEEKDGERAERKTAPAVEKIKQGAKQEALKAKRSEAAKKGWATRKAKQTHAWPKIRAYAAA